MTYKVATILLGFIRFTPRVKAMARLKLIGYLFLSLLSGAGVAGDAHSAKVPMFDKGASTFYVTGRLNGQSEIEFMIDTGSGYATINQQQLDEISSNGRAQFVRNVAGVMADGSEISMPIYRISDLNIGGNCVIYDIEVAVLPGRTRNILGLNVLKKAAPISLYIDPPTLELHNCGASDA